jgi:hypothetical protein
MGFSEMISGWNKGADRVDFLNSGSNKKIEGGEAFAMKAMEALSGLFSSSPDSAAEGNPQKLLTDITSNSEDMSKSDTAATGDEYSGIKSGSENFNTAEKYHGGIHGGGVHGNTPHDIMKGLGL